MATGQWWNIWILSNDPQQQDSIIEHTIQSATRPKEGSQAPKAWGGPGQIFTVNGPYKSKAEATGTSAKNHGPAPGSSGPPNAATSWEQAIGTFFGELSQASLWIRVAEVLAGLILIGVGIARITHAENFISKAVKAVPPL